MPRSTSSSPTTVQKVPRTILQSNPKYNGKSANVVSPDKEGNAKGPIPFMYIETILRGFGDEPDLYRDVLQVSPDALDRDIRIAYFRRGREVLAESGVRGLDEVATVGGVVSNVTRTRFQAVSMAYEIISTPAWKEQYRVSGLQPESMNDVMTVDSNDPIRGSVASLPSKPAVRWNEHVEELVYNRQPGEKTAKMQPVSSLRKKKRNKRVPAIVVDDALDEHLKKLDEEAEVHLVTDFFDSLEESLDGLLRLTSSDKRKEEEPPVMPVPAIKNRKKSSDSSVDSEATPFDEPDPVGEELLDNLAAQMLGRETPPSDEATCNSASVTGDASRISSRQSSPFRPISPYQAPEEEAPFDMESASFSSRDNPFTTTTSAAVVPPEEDKVKANRKPPGRSTECDVFEGLEDVADGDTLDDFKKMNALLRRSESPATTGSMSDLSVSLAPSARSVLSKGSIQSEASHGMNTSVVGNRPRAYTPDCFDDHHCDALCEAHETMHQLTFGPTEDREPGLPTTTRREVDGDRSSSENETSKDEDGFIEYFIAYISAIVTDCQSMGTNICDFDWQDTMFAPFMVDDGDVEGLAKIVENELQHAPFLQTSDVVQEPTAEAVGAVRSFG